MSNPPNHDHPHGPPTESSPDGPVSCCRICRLEADGGRRSTASATEHTAHDHGSETAAHPRETDEHARHEHDPEPKHEHAGTDHGHASNADAHDADAHDSDAHDADAHDADAHNADVQDHDGRGREGGGGHGHEGGHGDHEAHTDHSGHEEMFRRRFWVSLVLSVPVIVFSEFVQDALGYTAPTFPGSAWITPVLSVVIFAYGGVPFLSMARTELENREPGMIELRAHTPVFRRGSSGQ